MPKYYSSIHMTSIETQDPYLEIGAAIAKHDLPRLIALLDGGSDSGIQKSGVTKTKNKPYINKINKQGQSLLYQALNHNASAICLELLKRGATIDPLAFTRAVFSNNLSMLAAFTKHGADVDMQTEDGRTGLVIAIRGSNKKIFTMLMDQGANVNIPDKYGDTPFFVACSRGHVDFMTALISKGCNINHKTTIGQSALHLAVYCKRLEVCDRLISLGLDVNGQSFSLETPLHHAADDGDLEVCRFLIDRGAKIDMQNNVERTPLMLAALSGHSAVCLLLLDNGADLSSIERIIASADFIEDHPDCVNALRTWRMGFLARQAVFDCMKHPISFNL